ncbi:hypothetical protein DZK27_06710 [Rhodobacteraceae bacterium 63075]|nr:hypothetical protein DZK27_06710 [Rhodobacteraceae bacterium 63075]
MSTSASGIRPVMRGAVIISFKRACIEPFGFPSVSKIFRTGLSPQRVPAGNPVRSAAFAF